MKKSMRFAVFQRDNFICQYCGKRPPEVRLELDHVLPKSQGGTDDEWNLKTACMDCNRGKRDAFVTGRAAEIPDPPKVDPERQKKLERYAQAVLERDRKRSEELNALLDLWLESFYKVDADGFYRYSESITYPLIYGLKMLPLSVCKSAVEITCKRKLDAPESERGKYFCGVIRKILKEVNTPGESKEDTK